MNWTRDKDGRNRADSRHWEFCEWYVYPLEGGHPVIVYLWEDSGPDGEPVESHYETVFETERDAIAYAEAIEAAGGQGSVCGNCATGAPEGTAIRHTP